MPGWWPFGKKETPDMKASSRVQCYDRRDEYFFCLGARAGEPVSKRAGRGGALALGDKPRACGARVCVR